MNNSYNTTASHWKYPQHTLQGYLKLLFKDLQNRSGKKEVDIAAFQEFFQIPMLIVEKLFQVFNFKGNEKEITMKEFIAGMMTLLTGNAVNQAKIIFQCFDFDIDGIIKIEDIKFLFLHLHLAQQKSNSELLPIILDVVEAAFNSMKQKTLDFKNFYELSEKLNGDIVHAFLFFLWKFLPFKENQISFFHNQLKIKNEIKRKVPNENSYISNNYLKPSQKFCHYVTQLALSTKKDTEDEELENDLAHLKLFEEDLEKEISLAKEVLESKSIKFDLRNLYTGSSFPSSGSLSTNLSSTDGEKCFSDESICLSYYKSGKIHKCKLVLVDDILFYHKFNPQAEVFTIHKLFTLKSTFVTKCEEAVLNNKIYFSFQLRSNYSFCVTFLGEDEEEIIRFTNLINAATNFRKIEDFYTLEKEIGSGQFGKVKLAVNKTTQEKVAVKIIPKREEDNFLIRWEYNVFKFLQSISHPGIVNAIDIFETVNHIYLVYEYIPGGDFKAYLSKREIPLTSIEIKSLAAQLIEALAFLHHYGIIHRDLKPTNILVGYKEKGKPMLKIIDFGFSKIMAENSSTSEPYGTILYTAPEIILGNPYNHKVDVWSLGVIIYFILFGVQPFESGNTQNIKKAIAFKDVMFPPSKYLSQNDKTLLDIIEITSACLQKSTSTRPQIFDLKI